VRNLGAVNRVGCTAIGYDDDDLHHRPFAPYRRAPREFASRQRDRAPGRCAIAIRSRGGRPTSAGWRFHSGSTFTVSTTCFSVASWVVARRALSTVGKTLRSTTRAARMLRISKRHRVARFARDRATDGDLVRRGGSVALSPSSARRSCTSARRRQRRSYPWRRQRRT
jgi:hypothetical protein